MASARNGNMKDRKVYDDFVNLNKNNQVESGRYYRKNMPEVDIDDLFDISKLVQNNIKEAD